jgi:hypothetical protein
MVPGLPPDPERDTEPLPPLVETENEPVDMTVAVGANVTVAVTDWPVPIVAPTLGSPEMEKGVGTVGKVRLLMVRG